MGRAQPKPPSTTTQYVWRTHYHKIIGVPAHKYNRKTAIRFWRPDFSCGAGAISSPVRDEHFKNLPDKNKPFGKFERRNEHSGNATMIRPAHRSCNARRLWAPRRRRRWDAYLGRPQVGAVDTPEVLLEKARSCVVEK